MKPLPIVALTLLGAGCQDYGMSGLLEDSELETRLVIEPSELRFDDTPHDELAEKSVVRSNEGGSARPWSSFRAIRPQQK